MNRAWIEIPSGEAHAWNQRLLQTDASFQQYPYWNDSLRRPYFLPRYFVYGSVNDPTAYVCVLTLGIPGAFIGLVEQGPVNLLTEAAHRLSALDDLVRWAKRHGYTCLRFADSNHEFIKTVAADSQAKQADVFPFHQGPSDDLIVEQTESDDEMLASFRATARYQIRRAQRLEYTLEITDSPERFAELWPLFEARAIQKGFRMTSLSWYLNLIRSARSYGCIRVYAAHRDGRLVQAIVLVRDGTTAYYIAGAVDVEAEGKSSDSPSCLLHWSAMRDFYRLGIKRYSLGGGSKWWRETAFYQFKRKFNPVETLYPPPVTIVTNRMLYSAWSWGGLRLWPRIRPLVKRFITRT